MKRKIVNMQNAFDIQEQLADIKNWTSEEFLNKVIVPAHWHIAKNSTIRFAIYDLTGKIVICSNQYAQEIGFESFQDAIAKRPYIDYHPPYDYIELKDLTTDMVVSNQNNAAANYKYTYIYRVHTNGSLYLASKEPIVDLNGNIIAIKDLDHQVRLFSPREIVERHFKLPLSNARSIILKSHKKASSETANNKHADWNDDIKHIIPLSKNEELVLFMLIAGYSQQEIASLLEYSRSYIVKIIAEGLCVKFGLPSLSTKILIDKAISMGYALFIPEKFLHVFNEQTACYH